MLVAPALPWGGGVSGQVSLKHKIDYHDLLDGLLLITLKVNDEAVDGIITYDENDDKYYLGTIEEPKYFEVVLVNSKKMEISAITENVELTSIEREFPEIVGTEPELPWNRGITATLTLSNPVEQQWILDKLKVITMNVSSGQESKRSFYVVDNELQIKTSTTWIAKTSSFEGRLSQLQISTNNLNYTTYKVVGFVIE